MPKEEVRYKCQSLTAMLNDLQSQVMIIAVRGKLNVNIKAEMRAKLDWVKAELESMT